MTTLLDQLEAIKREGNYAVTLYYGSDDVGLDDMDQLQGERPIKVFAVPGGYLGGLRKLWVAESLVDFLDMDLAAKPKVAPNPPKREYLTKPGIYVWGTEDAVRSYRKKRD